MTGTYQFRAGSGHWSIVGVAGTWLAFLMVDLRLPREWETYTMT